MEPFQFQFYLPESKYLFRFVELEKRFAVKGKTVVRLMAYENFAVQVGNLPNDELRILLEELLSKLAKSEIKVQEFSKPTWACDQLFGGSYPNNPGIRFRLSKDYLRILLLIKFYY